MRTTVSIEWVPVSEEWPDDSETVMVFSPDIGDLVWLGWWDSEDDVWRSEGGAHVTKSRVTHWATMPEGPDGN